MPKISELTISNFRGIRETTLNLGGCSLVILGENGTGKSSFIDSLEFYFSGIVSHLEGAQRVSTTRHAPHVLAADGQTFVSIKFNQNVDTCTRNLRGFQSEPDELKNFHVQGKNAKFILRRKNLLDFILAQPGPRYEQLAAIIGVADLEKTERALRQMRDQSQIELDELGSKIDNEKANLNLLLGVNQYDEEAILVGLNTRLEGLKQDRLQTLSDAEARKLSAIALSRSPSETEEAAKLQNIRSSALRLYETSNFINNYQSLWTSIEKLQSDIAQVRELLFQEVLKSSQRVFKEYVDINLCPVCQQPINREELLLAIEDRLAKTETLSRLATSIVVLRDALKNAIEKRLDEVNKLVVQVSGHGELGPSENEILGYKNRLECMKELLRQEPVDLQLGTMEIFGGFPEVQIFESYLWKLINKLQNEENRLTPTDQDRQTLAVIDLLTLATTSHTVLRELEPRLIAKQATYREIDTIYETFLSTKRNKIRQIYNDIQTDIQRYFHYLHHDEGYDQILLEVNDDRRASTEIKMDFHERHQEDPRAFNSEGHLDSLGLCVFLAFVKRFNLDFPIIALDDVVSSIDAGHRQRICDLLFDEFPDTQLFITTHDYVWFEELRAIQITRGKQSLFHNLQILNWTLQDGPRLDVYKSRWNRIQEKISDCDRDGAAASTRKELEAFLYEAAVSICARTTIKRDARYVVSDLYDPLIAQYRKLVDPKIFASNKPVFDTLQTNGIFGNLLTHNNPRADGASLDEVRNFVKAVMDFEAVFTCPGCGKIVTYFRDAKILRCKCRENGILWATRE